MPPRLQLTDITKRYPTVVANDAVSLVVEAGEIHAVLGENGAGKSTLMKIIGGAVRPDAGQITVDGRAVVIDSPLAAQRLGIAMVHQHFALFDTLTAAENVALGLPSSSTPAQTAQQMRDLGSRYGLDVDPQARAHDLSMGERQRIEILRGLLAEPRLLILDEPTSVLTPQATRGLFDTLRRLAAEGLSVLFISHKLDEIRALATVCTVMRQGRVVARVDPRAVSEAELARLMIGADPPQLAGHAAPPGAPRLQVQGLHLRAGARIDLTVARGEIVGVAGIAGNGQRELMALLSGERASAPDSIRLDGTPIGALGPAARRARGLRYVPEERLGHGAVPEMSLAENTLLTGDALRAGGWVRRPAMRALAAGVIARFTVKAAGPAALASSLSGGNLQKFIVGRELAAVPVVLLVDQPTWGVDVGAAAAIRNALIELRAHGAALLVVSEELDELFALADRIVVLAQGRMSPPVAPGALSIEELGRWMAGLWPADAVSPAVPA